MFEGSITTYIIVLTLFIVVLIHLFYSDKNNSNSADLSNRYEIENMHNTKHNKAKCKKKKSKDKNREDAHRVSRDFGPLHQTSKKDTPYYHILNKIVKDNSVNSDHSDHSDYSDYSYYDFSKIKKKIKNKDKKITFADNYEGTLADPFMLDDRDLLKDTRLVNSNVSEKGFLVSDPFKDKTDNNDNFYDNCEVGCSTDLEMRDIKKYLREYVLDGKDQCYCVSDPSKSEFTRDEIDKYREKHIEFRDKIGGTSADFEDPVDKMNEIGIEGIKGDGMSISGFFDSILENDVDRQLKGNPEKYIMNQNTFSNRNNYGMNFNKEPLMHTNFFSQTANTGGKYILRDNWMYSNENPNNGGADSTGIIGSDPLTDFNLMI